MRSEGKIQLYNADCFDIMMWQKKQSKEAVVRELHQPEPKEEGAELEIQ